uniref:Uncharacterized protein n=1 Tax=Phakopsora pachyrhizi TaxID=170000 RepID=A0A0S1MJP8_PHAPC
MVHLLVHSMIIQTLAVASILSSLLLSKALALITFPSG